MGRKKCDIVRKYFKISDDGKKLQCVIEDCSSTISDHSTNLQKHLELNHPNEFTMVMLEKEGYKRSATNVQNTANKNIKKPKFDLMDACVRFITIHGRPFSLIDDAAFQDIINTIPSQKETINSHKVHDAIAEEAINVKRKIKGEIKGKLISLKVDGATCLGRSFLGINIQFMKDGKIHIRTLGVVELFERHSAEYLKNVITHTCSTYGITTKQIYTVTVDNAANRLKTVKILNEEDDECDNLDDENNADEITGSEITDVLINSEHCDYNNDSTEIIDNEFLITPDFTIKTIRCAAHTLQLAVSDLLKKQEVLEIVEKVRKVVKKLRTPLLKSTLLAVRAKSAMLDCVTRWHSTFDMLQRLLELKEYCEQIKDNDLKLSESVWAKMIDLINVLKPARIATKRLQSELLLLGDLYEIWQRCLIEVKKKIPNLQLNLLIT